MRFELDFFESFIQRELKPKKGRSITEFSKKTKSISDEVERIKKVFRSHLFNMENESRLEQYIQHHQTHIILLADRVLKFIDKEEAVRISHISDCQTQINLCKILYKALEDLLTYIEGYFSKYFNQDSKIPDCYAFLSVKEIEEKVRIIYQECAAKKVDPALIGIALYPVEDFVNVPEKQNITFSKLIYLKQLVKDFLMLLNKENSKDYTEDIYGWLYYLNFNTYYFLSYATEKISREVQELPSLSDQIERLSFLSKCLSQLHTKPGFSMKPDRPSIREQVVTWLEIEIHYIQKKNQYSLMIPPGKYLDTPIDNFKVNTSLSVPQLACYVRLLLDAGVITNKNQAELLRFYSKYFSSLKNENVSSESLRTKYYNIDKSTVTGVQDVLHKLLSLSKKMLNTTLLSASMIDVDFLFEIAC